VKRTNGAAVRTVFFLVFIVGLVGTGLDLLLLTHYESLSQFIPLVLIAAGILVAVWNFAFDSSVSSLALRLAMTAFIAAGALGVALHYRGNVQFQREIDPSINGMALFSKVIHAKAPPAMAPAAMIWLGLFGIACTYLPDKKRGEL